jgi:hypothetical protein
MRTAGNIAASACRGALAFIAVIGMDVGMAAAATATQPHPSASKAQEESGQQHAPGVQPADPDPASRNVVARARMLECGHQWSNMKRAGTASGTWKDFSRGCLAQR